MLQKLGLLQLPFFDAISSALALIDHWNGEVPRSRPRIHNVSYSALLSTHAAAIHPTSTQGPSPTLPHHPFEIPADLSPVVN